MRRLALLAALQLSLFAVEDPLRLFRDCAYSAVLPNAKTPPDASFALEIEGQPAGSGSWDRLFDPKDRFYISISATRSGYFYLLQDPADPGVLIFPGGPSDDNFVTHEQDRRLPRNPMRCQPGPPLRLLMVFSHTAIPDLDRMTVKQAREYLEPRARCGRIVLEERVIHPK
jgi:hypothetical protein